MISYFFLDLKGDTSDGTLLDSLHQVGGETGNLISHSLGRKDSNIGKDLLVEVEVSSELAVVLFD